MGKIIKFKDEARKGLKEGVDEVANAVKVTLGARGRNVIIDRGFPHVTKDGVTVAESIFFEDPIKNMGASMIKEAARRTCDDSGDGTSTACVLTQAMINAGLKHIKGGYNPMELRKGIDIATKQVINFIKAQAQSVPNSSSYVEEVATVSANNDKEIGKLIAKAFKKVTSQGTVTVEEAKGYETELKFVEGLRFDKGFYSPHFINTSKSECVLENPYILVSDKKIQTIDSIYPLIEKVIKDKRPLLIICEDMEVEPLSSLIINSKKGGFKSCVVKCPGFGDIKKEWLEDIAILTGGKYVSDDKADKISKLPIKALGGASKIVITKKDTTIIGGKGSKKDIGKRIESINADIKETKNQFKKDQFKTRIAKLIGGIAIISIGGNSETEVKERADRIDDSISATKAAFEEGIVPGGGIVYMRASERMVISKMDSPSIAKGMEIVKEAIRQPFFTILDNAGISLNKKEIKYAKNTQGGYGYDVIGETFDNLYRVGIIDPAKVLRVALVNASSVSGLFLTTECSITDKQ